MSELRRVRGLMGGRGSVGAPNNTARCRLLCRFLGRRHDDAIHALWRPASEKRQGTKSRKEGAGGAAGAMGIWPRSEASGDWSAEVDAIALR